MRLKFLLILSVVILTSSQLYSQTIYKDSLLKIANANQLDSSTVSAFLNLGNVYKQEQDSTKSADYYFKALNLAKKIDFKRGVIVALTEIGYLAEVTEDMPKAKKYYTSAIQYGKANNLQKQVALAYSYMFFIYQAKSDFKSCIIYADSALKIFEKLNRKPDIANQLNNIGTSYWKLNKNLEAIKYLQKTLSIYDEIGLSAEPNKSTVYNNIGLVFEELKSHDKAIEYFKRALFLSKKYNSLKNLRDAYNNTGNVYLNTKKYEKALNYYKLSLPLAKKSDQAQAIGIAYANIATCLINLKKYEEAERYMNLSDKEYKSIDNKYGLVSNMINSSQLLTETKRINQAEDVLKKALEISNKNDFSVLKQSIFESMAEVSKQKGEFDKAYMQQDSALQLQNKNYNFETNKQIANLEVKYKTVEKEKEILKNKTELLVAGSQIQKRNYWLIITGLAIFLLALGTVLTIRNAKLKREKLKEESIYNLNIAKEQTKNQVQEEKLRISRELHDNIGAQLSFINGSIQNMASADIENEQLQQTKEITQNTIKELRSTVWLINGQEFGLEEFVVKLREYLKPYYGGKPNINIENISNSECVLEPIVATNLFRIIQEAVNNAVKYANANELNINFKAEPNTLAIDIKDDGIGYDSEKQSQGYGLKNMQARVNTLNGSISVETAINTGTAIYLKLPI